MNNKFTPVYCLELRSRLWCRMEETRWRLGSLPEFRKHGLRPGGPKLIEFAGHRGENCINRDILHTLTKLTQEKK